MMLKRFSYDDEINIGLSIFITGLFSLLIVISYPNAKEIFLIPMQILTCILFILGILYIKSCITMSDVIK
jgi:hypothetical protein